MGCKFREQASTAIQSQSDSLSFAVTQFRQWFAGKTQMATLAVLLGLGGGLWVSLEVISPQVAQADTKRLDLTIERQPNETYETLLRRAEAAAKAAAQASFDQDDQVTDVSVIIVGQNQGSLAPVLSMEVSRPNAQSGVKYFTSARALLKFEEIATTTPDQNRTNNPATSPRRTTRTSGQNRTTSPTASPGQGTNRTSGQPGSINPTGTPGQTPNNTFGQPGTVNPTAQPNNTENPVQTPPPGAGMAPQAPTNAPVTPSGNSQSPTSPNGNSFPSSTPTSGSQNPVAAPSSTSGTTIINPSPTSVPNSSNNPIAPTTPNTSFPGGGNNTTPNSTPNLNVIPDESSMP